MSADSNLHYIVSPITFKLIFTVTEAKNRAVENWGNLILGKCRDLPYPSLSRFRVVSNDCVRSIESVSKEKSKRKKRNKKKKRKKKLVPRERLHSSSARIKVPSMCGGCTHVNTSLT